MIDLFTALLGRHRRCSDCILWCSRVIEMIEEKHLEEWALVNLLNSRRLGKTTIREVLRLARLGLWAEKHGVPALKDILSNENIYDTEGSLHAQTLSYCSAKEAINALPKGEK